MSASTIHPRLGKSCYLLIKYVSPKHRLVDLWVEDDNSFTARQPYVKAIKEEQPLRALVSEMGDDPDHYTVSYVKANGWDALQFAAVSPSAAIAAPANTNTTEDHYLRSLKTLQAIFPFANAREAAIREIKLKARNAAPSAIKDSIESRIQRLLTELSAGHRERDMYSAVFLFLLLGSFNGQSFAPSGVLMAIDFMLNRTPLDKILEVTNWLSSYDKKSALELLAGESINSEITEFQSTKGSHIEGANFPIAPIWWEGAQDLNIELLNSVQVKSEPISGGSKNRPKCFAPSHTTKIKLSAEALAAIRDPSLSGAGSQLYVNQDGTIDVTHIETYCVETRNMCVSLAAELNSLRLQTTSNTSGTATNNTRVRGRGRGRGKAFASEAPMGPAGVY